MAITFSYPDAFQFKGYIEPDYVAQDRADRLGLQIMPIQTVDASEVRWAQEDNYYGLQHMRGLDGSPTRVQRVGETIYSYAPGYFGDFFEITETELTRRAGYTPDGSAISVADATNRGDRVLIGREDDRIESSIWSILQGSLNITLDGTDGKQTQVYTDTYPIQTFTAGVTWATTATATPIANFQSVQQLQIGHSVDFGAGATAYMNNKTANYLLNNANSSDFGGRRSMYGATLNNLTMLNGYWQAQNLPKLVSYDRGYFATQSGALIGGGTNFTKFIPDNKVIVVGARPNNAVIGNYMMTRNANNPGFGAGSYRYIKNSMTGENCVKQTPPYIQIHRGHNGGPTLLYPSAVVVMNV